MQKKTEKKFITLLSATTFSGNDLNDEWLNCTHFSNFFNEHVSCLCLPLCF